jgi:hypothetical protein
MATIRLQRSNIPYLRQLFGAGLDGIASGRRERSGGVFTPTFERVMWAPSAIVSAVGILSNYLDWRRRS